MSEATKFVDMTVASRCGACTEASSLKWKSLRGHVIVGIACVVLAIPGIVYEVDHWNEPMATALDWSAMVSVLFLIPAGVCGTVLTSWPGAARYHFLHKRAGDDKIAYHVHDENPVSHENLLQLGAWHDATFVIEMNMHARVCKVLRAPYRSWSWRVSVLDDSRLLARDSDNYVVAMHPSHFLRVCSEFGCVNAMIAESVNARETANEAFRLSGRMDGLTAALQTVALLTGTDKEVSITPLGPAGRRLHAYVTEALGDEIDPKIAERAASDAREIAAEHKAARRAAV